MAEQPKTNNIMDIKVTIDISPESANNLAAAFSKLGVGGAVSVPAGTPTETVSTDTTKATPKAKAEKPAPKAVTIDDLRAVATECVNAGKKPRLVEINNGFGVAGISKLAPEQYADALKAYEALLKEPVAEEDPTA